MTGNEGSTMTIPPDLEAQILRYHHVEKWRAGTIARQLRVHYDTVLRVLRGGAYYNKAGAVGCGARGYFPDLSRYYYGFRVVASPSTSGL